MKPKVLGNIKTISANITKPLVMNELNLDLKTIMILVGTNGTGKTFVLKLTWVLSTIANHILVASKQKIPFDNKINAQFLIDNTFTDNDLTGQISIMFESFDSLIIVLDEGKITNLTVNIDEGTQSGAQPIFMSKETRLLSDVAKYIKLKKVLGFGKGMPSTEEGLKKLLEFHRIYDIIYIEQLLLYIETKTTAALIGSFNTRIKEFDENFQLIDIKLDYDKPDILYSDSKNTNVSITTLGAGHQSLINMIIFQEYQSS